VQKPGVDAALPRIAFPLAPKAHCWTTKAGTRSVARTEPLAGRVQRDAEDWQ